MRRGHFDALAPVCPTCRTAEAAHRLVLGAVAIEDADHVVEGLLACSNPACRREYPVLDGVPMLVVDLRAHVAHSPLHFFMRDDLSPLLRGVLGDVAGAGSPLDVLRQHLSHYAADHYGDLDPAVGAPVGGSVRDVLRAGLDILAASGGAREVDPALDPAGDPARAGSPALDVGCAVGRASFALAEATDGLVLGVDLNFGMLRVAARLLREGRLRYPLRRVGLVYDERDVAISLPGRERVDFWMADALALPFATPTFGLVASLNLLDCLPDPAAHLAALRAVLRPDGGAVLATPFDWSPQATTLAAWVGGHSQRAEDAGASEPRLRALLAASGLSVVGSPVDVPWSVRVHARAAMAYQTHVVAARPG